MTTILVGVDGSERSDDAIALARRLAAVAGARILLAAAVPYPAIALLGDGVAAVAADEMIAQSESMLAGKAAVLREAGLDVDTAVRAYVSPAHFLQELVASADADLVIVGSAGEGRLGRVLPGTTGERLLHGSPCPVAIAPVGYRDAPRSVRRVGVAFDGSDEARAALDAAVALATRLDADLEVVTVLDVVNLGSPALLGGPGYVRTHADIAARAREHLDEVVEELPVGVRATGCVLEGAPHERLAEHSGTLDLLLAGSRRYGPLRAVLLGGVSGQIIRHAACPVLITPRGVERPLWRLLASAHATGSTP
jgi:nucleotide-binding universal stress UspA family protein